MSQLKINEKIEEKTANEIVEEMFKQVPKEDIGERPGKGGRTLSYIPINKTIFYLTQRSGARWGGENLQVHIVRDYSAWDSYSKKVITDCVGVIVQYDIVIYDNNGIVLCRRPAVGACRIGAGRDLDDAVKSALAEATKKGGNMLGLGNFLWEDDSSSKQSANNSNSDTQEFTFLQENKEKMQNVRVATGLSNEDMGALLSEMVGTKTTSSWLYIDIDVPTQNERVDKFIDYIRNKTAGSTSSF